MFTKVVHFCQYMQSVFGGNQMLGCSILLGMPAFHGATFCNIVLDHGVLLLRCSGISQHLARGTKGARLWRKAAWPESVFHVAVMLVPWFDACLWRWSLHIVFSSSARCRVRVWCQSEPLLLQFVGHGGVSMGPGFCKIVWQLCAKNQPIRR